LLITQTSTGLLRWTQPRFTGVGGSAEAAECCPPAGLTRWRPRGLDGGRLGGGGGSTASRRA